MTPARACAVSGYFGLLSLWITWSIRPGEGSHPPTALLLTLSTLPLLLGLRGLLHDRRSAYLGLALLTLIYFIHGVGAYTDPSQRLPAGLEVLFSLLLFGGALRRLRSKSA